MILKEKYNLFLNKLQSIYSFDEATIITNWVFEDIGKISKIDLQQLSENKMNIVIAKNLDFALENLLQHKPIQYVLENAWFYKLQFKVNEHVLIPRPETEELVSLLLKEKNQNSVSILDVGTGSGCIAISLKKNWNSSLITAIDFSEQALVIAKENANYHNASIEFLKINFLEENLWTALPKFNFIVSNPPYIPLKEKNTMDAHVINYEPHSALFVANELPLVFYEKIAKFGKKHLHTNGKIFLETHENYAEETAHIFENGYKNIEIIKDIFEKNRFVVATIDC